MLARYLRTSQQRVRYAMPQRMHPDLAQALSNYLMIHSRAYDLPGAHHQTLPHLEGNPQILTALMHGILQGHHETPGMYLDQLHEMSPQLARIPPRPYPESDDPLENLPHYLHHLAHVVGNPQLAYGYGHVGQSDPETQRILRSGAAGALPGQGYQPGQALSDLMRHPATPHDLRGYLEAVYSPPPMNRSYLNRMFAMHDLSGEEMRRGDYIQRPTAAESTSLGAMRGHAGSLNAGIREVLRDHLIPHLDELTRQMGGG